MHVHSLEWISEHLCLALDGPSRSRWGTVMVPPGHAGGPFGWHWVPCFSKGSTPLSRPQRIWGHWVSDRVGPPKLGFGHRLWSGRGGRPPHL